MIEARPDEELVDYHLVAAVLEPLPVIVWGELAMRFLGVPTGIMDYMFGIADKDFQSAIQKLVDSGFIRENWSFSSVIDPSTRQDARLHQRHAGLVTSYANVDSKTVRFHHSDPDKCDLRVVLLPSSYIHLEASMACASPQPPFYLENNLRYPNAILLLRSVVRVFAEEYDHFDQGGIWTNTLACWADTYLYGELRLKDNILDEYCEDEIAKEEFDKLIMRGSGRSRIREKWGREKPHIINDLIKDFQID